MAAIEIEGRRSFLGFGLVRPFQRAGGADFVTAGGERGLASALGQILGTTPGDLRWRPSFGADLQPIRHQNMTEERLALAITLATNSIVAFEPRIQLQDVKAESIETKLRVSARWQAIATNNPLNQVLTGPVVTEVEL